MTISGSNCSVNTYSYMDKMSAEDCIAHLVGQGYHNIELMIYPGHIWPSEASAARISAFRALCERNRVRLVGSNIPNTDINVCGASVEAREYSLGVLASIVRLSGELGIEAVVLGTGRPNVLLPMARERARGYIYSALDLLLPVAQEAGVTLLLENIPFCFIPRTHDLMQLLAEYGSDEIKVVFDVANAHFVGDELSPALRAASARLQLLHLSDTTVATYQHAPLGTGEVPFASLPEIVEEIGFRGPVVLELITTDPDAAFRDGFEKAAAWGF